MANDDVLAELGLWPRWVARGQAATQPAEQSATVEAAPAVRPAVRAVGMQAPARPAAGEAEALAAGDADARRLRIAALDIAGLAADIAACTACKLCATRNRVVPGVGDLPADWMFVGEAPGAEEDARGEPFVGQAGRLLDAMLAALGLSRTRNVYIANVLKCRPPGNRTPEPLEAEACKPYLARQVELVSPKIIVALGRSAATLLTGVDAPIASMRGRVHRHQGVPLVVTYHPAYLLRNLPDKSKAWEDLLFARRTMGDPPPVIPAQAGSHGSPLARG